MASPAPEGRWNPTAQRRAAETAKCRPPADTPIGAVGWLSNGAVEIAFRWSGRRWESMIITGRTQTPSELARRGWRLDRMEPPAAAA